MKDNGKGSNIVVNGIKLVKRRFTGLQYAQKNTNFLEFL